jgi:uncharacterized protein (DUF362 family)
MLFSRRKLFQVTGAGLLASQAFKLNADTAPDLTPPPSVGEYPGISQVALVKGDDRRKNITAALTAIDDQIKPKLAQKKYVLIKPNVVWPKNQLACTHIDTLRGILDYLAPRWSGPIVIAEACGMDTMEGYEMLNYTRLPGEFHEQKISLVDMKREPHFETISILDGDLHMTPVRLVGRLFDPNAFIISSANLKTHSSVVATMTVKNMVMGSPLISPKGMAHVDDKRKFHAIASRTPDLHLTGVRQHHYNMFITAQKLQPFWGLGVIDGFEGMEGEGPASGTPAGSRIAIASTDLIAADRIGAEAMGINPSWIGYLVYSGQVGVGNYDREKIQLRGVALDAVRKNYRLPPQIEDELKWMQAPADLGKTVGEISAGDIHDQLDKIYGRV